MSDFLETIKKKLKLCNNIYLGVQHVCFWFFWGSDFFCVLLWLILYISLYFLYNINISGIGWLVGGSFMSETFLAINVTV